MHHLGVEADQCMGGLLGAVQLVGAAVVEGQEGIAQRLRQRNGGRCEYLDRGAFKREQYAVHPVE